MTVDPLLFWGLVAVLAAAAIVCAAMTWRAVRGWDREIDALRWWRHDDAVPRAINHGERLARLEAHAGLPVEDFEPPKHVRPRAQA